MSGGILSRGILSRGDFGWGDFVRGDFVQGDFVRGDFVQGDFVLEPHLRPTYPVQTSHLLSLSHGIQQRYYTGKPIAIFVRIRFRTMPVL